MFDILDLLPQSLGTFKIIDVGALAIGQDDIYTPLVKAGRAQIVGFEPSPIECQRLRALHGPPHIFLPYVIADGSVRTFHITNTIATSSLYEPNIPFLSLFQNLEEVTRVVERRQVQTKRLDDIDDAHDADYLKLDVQGAELDVLNSAHRVLTEALVVQTEVEFVPMYLGQPLFAEVDQALRREGYLLHQLSFSGRTFRPLITDGDINRMGSQALWGQAIYLRNFMELNRLSPPKLLKLAAILHVVFGSHDMVPLVLRQYDALSGSSLSMQYLQKLTAAQA